jgi:bifunctional UDP-N-acetylglucosamine pyrophosphorylase/glucosamine-1-phosphate N-acetyltransferase
MEDPTGYGRLLRAKDGRVARVVEERDASLEQRAITEVNTGVYAFRRDLLGPALRRITPANTQGEYYLTDVVDVLYEAGHRVDTFPISEPDEAQGVNDRVQLAQAEAELRRRTARRWMLAGVSMLDPDRTAIDATVVLERDVTLYPGTMLQGHTVVGAGAEIGPDTRLVNCVVGPGAVVENSVGHDAAIGAGARVGPFAVLEAGASVGEGVTTGPFYTGRADETDHVQGS